MARFRRLAQTVEARQFWPRDEPWPTGVYQTNVTTGYGLKGPGFVWTITPGDWIVLDERGELFPCNQATFEKCYVEVAEEPTLRHGEDPDISCPCCGMPSYGEDNCPCGGYWRRNTG